MGSLNSDNSQFGPRINCAPQDYYSDDRWQNDVPYGNGTDEYSTVLFGERAIEIVNQHPQDTPLFMYLAWQAVGPLSIFKSTPKIVESFPLIPNRRCAAQVHSPYSPVPNWDGNTTEFAPYPGVYAGMIYDADQYTGACN